MAIDRRAKILEAAAQLFATQGYHVTTVSDIAQAAQVAQGTVYLYFDSKKAVFEALVDQTLGLFKDVLSWGTSQIDSANVAQSMPVVYRHVLDLLAKNRTLVRLMLTEVRGADPDLEAKLAAFYEEVVTKTSHHIQLGAQQGFFRSDINPRLVAQCLIAIMERFAALILTEESPDLDAMADELARFQLYGIVADR